MPRLSTKLFDEDVSSPTFIDDLTTRAKGMVFSTKMPGGFGICKFRMAATIAEAFEWFLKRNFYRLLVEEAPKTIWEGRVEDVGWEDGVLDVTAMGYYSSLGDEPYRTAYNDVASVVIKAILTAVCPFINSDQAGIEATDITITSAAAARYLDQYPKELVEKLVAFSDSTFSQWDFSIYDDRKPFLIKRSVSSVDWEVFREKRQLKRLALRRRGGELWNSAYALFDSGGLTRTSTTTDSDSVAKYGITRVKVVPDLGTVAQAAAEAARASWVQRFKEIQPRLTKMVVGASVDNSDGQPVPSYNVRSGDVLRIADLVPQSVDAGAVALDQLRTFYVVGTQYDVDSGILDVTPDLRPFSLTALLAGRR